MKISDKTATIICAACPILCVLLIVLRCWVGSKEASTIVIMLLGMIIISLVVKENKE